MPVGEFVLGRWIGLALSHSTEVGRCWISRNLDGELTEHGDQINF